MLCRPGQAQRTDGPEPEWNGRPHRFRRRHRARGNCAMVRPNGKRRTRIEKRRKPLPPRHEKNIERLWNLFLDWEPDRVAPFGPGAVVVLDVRVAEQVLQDEPGVGGPLSDSAVGDYLMLRGDPLGPV